MKHILLSLIASSVLVFSACNEKADKKNEAARSTTDSHTVTPEERGSFSELFPHYQHLSVALSSDDDKEAAAAAKGMLEALSKIKLDGFSAEDKATYGHFAASVKENAGHIADKVGNISHQREHLVVLSKDFYELAKTFGTEKQIYKVFCPMYDNDKGAYWLSDVNEVRNPYFGSEMLRCGLVQEELN